MTEALENSRGSAESTRLWQDLAELPQALEQTLAAPREQLVSWLEQPSGGRLLVSGGGAAYNVGLAFSLATAECSSRAPIAVPSGLLARGDIRWRPGDQLLVISASGESRDLLDALDRHGAPRDVALVTDSPTSALAERASTVAHTVVVGQRAVTHTQAFCGALALLLAASAEATGDTDLLDAVQRTPATTSATLGLGWAFAREALDRNREFETAIAFGTGVGWAAAAQAALVIREVAGVPCEGMETREAATSAMTMLDGRHLVLGVPVRNDPLVAEAERVCRSRGAAYARIPGGELDDPRVSPITTHAAAVTLALELALRLERDPDQPEWADTYFELMRR